MTRNIKLKIGFGLFILMLTVASLYGAIFLGKLYLNIFKEASMSNTKKVMSKDVNEVSVPDESKLLLLNPVPVYFLQVGVYSDMAGAQEAVKPLTIMGYKVYITAEAPHKIWLGVFKQREDTETVKALLREKGLGSFTGALVVNGSNLKYGKGSEAFVKSITPVLETYTLWFKENLEIFHADSAAKLDWQLIGKQEKVVSSVYEKFYANKNIRTNNQAVNSRFKAIEAAIDQYNQQMKSFKVQKSNESYILLQSHLLRFIDNYLLLLMEIENLSKT